MQPSQRFEVWLYDATGEYEGCLSEQYETRDEAKRAGKKAFPWRSPQKWSVVTTEAVLEYVGRGDRV